MLVQLEDVLSEVEQANLPGTTDAHPNWRRRLSRSLEEIDRGVELRRVAALIEEARLARRRKNEPSVMTRMSSKKTIILASIRAWV